MKFSIHKKDILDVLSNIQGITGRKTNLSITCDVLITALGSSITLTANDMETVFVGSYDAQVEVEGVLSINSRKFFEIIKEYPDDFIQVNELDNRWVEIGAGDSVFHIVSSDYTNFPKTPLIEDVSFIQVNARELKKMINTSSAILYASDEKRPYIIGSFLEKIISPDGKNIFRMVSTDSKRLNCFDTEFTGDFDIPEEGVLVPKKGLSELGKFIDTGADSIQLGIKDNHFIFQRAGESIMIKLLEGQFPAYKPVLDFSSMVAVDIDRTTFINMLRRISIFTSDDYKTVMLHFKDNELLVTITNPDLGESKERIMISYEGEEVSGGYNPKYFRDALNLFEGDMIQLYIKDGRSPCLIRHPEDDHLICLIMAISIS